MMFSFLPNRQRTSNGNGFYCFSMYYRLFLVMNWTAEVKFNWRSLFPWSINKRWDLFATSSKFGSTVKDPSKSVLISVMAYIRFSRSPKLSITDICTQILHSLLFLYSLVVKKRKQFSVTGTTNRLVYLTSSIQFFLSDNESSALRRMYSKCSPYRLQMLTLVRQFSSFR